MRRPPAGHTEPRAGGPLAWAPASCPARQEPPGDAVDIDAAGTAGPGEVSLSLKFGEVAPGGAFRDTSLDREGAQRREAAPGMVGKADEALHCPSQARLQRAVDGEMDGDE